MHFLIDELISSASQSKVLRVLLRQDKPVHLRLLSNITATPVRSIELALKALSKRKLVKVTKQGRKKLYVLNARSPYIAIVSEVFKIEEQYNLKQRAACYSTRLQNSVQFIDQTIGTLEKLHLNES